MSASNKAKPSAKRVTLESIAEPPLCEKEKGRGFIVKRRRVSSVGLGSYFRHEKRACFRAILQEPEWTRYPIL